MEKNQERLTGVELAKYLKRLLNEGYHYLARSASGQLKAFKREPKKEINFWCCSSYSRDIEIVLDIGLFECIRWEDKQATSLLNILDTLKVKYDIDDKELE